MRLLPHVIFVSILFVRNSSQSQCIVSEWGSWSKCHGGCQRGLIVRNRDVLQPPLPELTVEGKMMQRLCPHLYETRYCEKPCEETPYSSPIEIQQNVFISKKEVNYQPQNRVENPVKSALGNGNGQQTGSSEIETSASNLVERQMEKVGFGSETEDTRAKLKRKFISETEQLFKLDDAINRRFGPQPSDNLVNNNNTSIIDISTQQMSNRQWKDDMLSTKSTTPSSSSYQEHIKAFTNSGKLRKYKSNNDNSVNSLLRRIEQALDTNQPLDEKYIKSAMRRNRKLSKLLVDAYRQKQKVMSQEKPSIRLSQTMPAVPVKSAVFGVRNYMTSTTPSVPKTTTESLFFTDTTSRFQTTTTQPVTPSTISTYEPYTYPHDPYTTTTAEELVDMSGTTVKMLYWPKTGGYVPNTRKHASEITAQLYMTNEIIQTLADDPLPIEKDPDCELNKRCCKVIKNACSEGVDPKFVKRWYRPKGSSVCVPYHYPRCSSMEEMEELPILFEQNCQDLCFSQQEKRIAPLFTLEAEDE